MSKQELIEYAAANAGLTKADANRALDAIIEGIKEGLKTKGKVTLVGFGTFESKHRDARDCRNPLTGETIHVEAKNAVTFKAGSKLKDSVNE